MSNIQPASQQAIRLQIDAASLRKQLRHAFSHAFAVVQELVQNARRAGATLVSVQYDEQRKMLTVSDDGCGIADFQTMLTFAASGWDDAIMATEQPYGMGFLSCLYASSRVEITSRGRRLAFDTAGMLGDESFALDAAPQHTVGTLIVLHGVELREAASAMHRIASGYPLPIEFNGQLLPRPDAVENGRFVATDVGMVRIGRAYCSHRTVAYIQGFRVHQPERYYLHENVVHLDPGKFRGVFPDRDRCIDEAEMLKAVEATVKRLYVERLIELKMKLPAADFCCQAYDLARSLDRLDVFNDVDAIPGEWLATIQSTPRCTYNDDSFEIREGEGEFTRSAIEAGEVPLVALTSFEGFDPLDQDDGGQSQLLWLYAYAAGAFIMSHHLDHEHWLNQAARRATGEASVEATLLHAGRIPWDRACEVGHAAVRLCQNVRIRCGDRVAELSEAFATVHDGETAFIVPCDVARDGTVTPALVDWDALRQATSYIDDSDALDEAALDTDAQEVNQTVRALLAKSPAAHLQLLLDAALRDYRSELKQFAAVTLAVDGSGIVTVESVKQADAVPA